MKINYNKPRENRVFADADNAGGKYAILI